MIRSLRALITVGIHMILSTRYVGVTLPSDNHSDALDVITMAKRTGYRELRQPFLTQTSPWRWTLRIFQLTLADPIAQGYSLMSPTTFGVELPFIIPCRADPTPFPAMTTGDI